MSNQESRVKPQFEVDRDTYKRFRSLCGGTPMSWVIEEILESLAKPGASDMASLSQAIARAKNGMEAGERRVAGRFRGQRDSYPRDRKTKT